MLQQVEVTPFEHDNNVSHCLHLALKFPSLFFGSSKYLYTDAILECYRKYTRILMNCLSNKKMLSIYSHYPASNYNLRKKSLLLMVIIL